MQAMHHSKRRRVEPVEEVKFDFGARENYLTGFHKRKQARIKHAQGQAAAKERLQKIKERKELREQRERDLHAHVEAVNAALKQAERGLKEQYGQDLETLKQSEPTEPSGTDSSVVSDDSGQENQYIDEDKYTTVTVEPMIDQTAASEDSDIGEQADYSGGEENGRAGVEASSIKAPDKNEPSLRSAGKRRKKKFRYETKAERKEVRAKQRAKKSAAAKARRARS